MAYLFIVENNIAKPNVETLLITPYKEIWERDDSSTKDKAIKEFTYIELMVSKKKSNVFAGYSDEKRHKDLKKMLFAEDWVPDKLVEIGLAKYAEFQREASPTYSYYISVCRAAEKMKTFFDTFNIDERNERTGLPIYKPGDITKSMIDTDKVLINLNGMKERVEQELFEQTKTRNNKTINPFEI